MTYIDNQEFYREILKFKRDEQNNVGEYLIKIANHLLGRSEFRGYPKSQQEEMVSFALYKSTKGLQSFKRQKTIKEGGQKAFNFFTRICYLSFITELKKYYKRVNLKRDLEEEYISKMETESPSIGYKMREDKQKIDSYYE